MIPLAVRWPGFDSIQRSRKRSITTSAPCSCSLAPAPARRGVLTHRIAHLIGGCGHPAASSILAVTFTNKAAGEMQRARGSRRCWGPTPAGALGLLHLPLDLALEVLLRRGHRATWGSPRRPLRHLRPRPTASASCVKAGAEASAARTRILKVHDPQTGLAGQDRSVRRTSETAPGPGRADSASDIDEELTCRCSTSLYQKSAAHEANALRLRGSRLLQTGASSGDRFPEVLGHWTSGGGSYVLVDEYQDTNRVQLPSW